MKQITAVGHHCYFGGFLLGLQRAGVNIRATHETWTEGGKAAKHLGLPVVLGAEEWNPPRADIVAANPPCSRFSVLAAMSYKQEQREDCGCFAELLDLHRTVKAVQPRLFWWETGPMAQSQGIPMMRTHHKMVEELFGEKVTTAIVYYDCRYSGLPQRRPRTHILHFRGDISKRLPSIQPSQWPMKMNAGDWLKKARGGKKLVNPIAPSEYLSGGKGQMATRARKARVKTPLDFVKWSWRAEGYRFMAQRPNVIDPTDSFFPAVITDVCHLVLPDNRWFDLREACVLMDYPVDLVLALLEEGYAPRQLLKLLSKSVSPSASQFLYNNLVTPVFERSKAQRDMPGWREPKDIGDGLFYYNLSVGDNPKRKTTAATREFIAKRSIDPPDRVAKLLAQGKTT